MSPENKVQRCLLCYPFGILGLGWANSKQGSRRRPDPPAYTRPTCLVGQRGGAHGRNCCKTRVASIKWYTTCVLLLE